MYIKIKVGNTGGWYSPISHNSSDGRVIFFAIMFVRIVALFAAGLRKDPCIK